MPQIANTPESILPRADSRNPASTCRGLTVNGRLCRRALATSTRSNTSKGVVAVLKGNDNANLNAAAAFYCWQHKDQAAKFTANAREPRPPEILHLAGRTSIDSLVERLGLLDVNDGRRNRVSHPRTGPLHEEPRRTQQQNEVIQQQSRTNHTHRRESKLCCFRIVGDSHDLPAPRPIPNAIDSRGQRPKSASRPSSTPQQRPVVIRDPHSPGRAQVIQQRPIPITPERWHDGSPESSLKQSLSPSNTPSRPGYPGKPTRPSLPSTPGSTLSQTQPLLSLIPSHLSPQTTALLLSEMAKPISDADEEGYIYIFWVTRIDPNSPGPPPRDIASSLLPPSNRHHGRRSTSDALRAAQAHDGQTRGSVSGPGTIRLKIGRTSNVHRRLNEWSKQCSHDLTLIRYYPYTSSSPSPSPARTPHSDTSHHGHGRRVPHVHRVERLIHIELADQRVKDQGPCPECGREHREWFEFAATKDALRLVDECVRRWVSWGERHE